jgi:hypothetical protein
MAVSARGGKSIIVAALAMVLSILVSDASGAGVSYTYDPSGRVTSAIYDNGMCVTYSYDAAGNRTTQTNATAVPAAWGAGAWGCFAWTP